MRVRQFFNHDLGSSSPHKGGHWIKTLFGLDEFFVHYAETLDHVSVETRLIETFASRASPFTKAQIGPNDHAEPYWVFRTPLLLSWSAPGMVDTTSRHSEATSKNSGLSRSTYGHHRTVRSSVLRRNPVTRSPSVRFSTRKFVFTCLLFAYFPTKSVLPLTPTIQITSIKSLH